MQTPNQTPTWVIEFDRSTTRFRVEEMVS